MTTDNKTLAGVQPGGRVRLGDQAELDRLEFQAWARELLPCPFCGNSAEFVPYKDNGLTLKCKSMGCIQRNQRTLRYGIDWLRTSMAEHWNTRALSAQPSPATCKEGLQVQPSPGGQDALVTDGMVEAAHAAYWAHPDDSGEDRPCIRAAIEAALAARQPVGEPVAWQSMATCPRDGTAVLLRWGEDHVSPGWWCAAVSPIQNEDGTWPRETGGFPWAFFDMNDGVAFVNHAVDTEYGPTHWAPYVYPAAQAVDLGAVRQALQALARGDMAEAQRVMAHATGGAR
ncbi:Uncharacterised protein [Stenotrophomonas maltophilia]|jgi:hypothetical protein|uniref:Lar family restriction alleviation protein n=1 Tax=Stenotrophomonas maltophilia TaxID=40324 RepID=UPI000DA350CD|nr:Lar family restriction alleviation protein [Stenotrophomonas maltophilia]SQG66897.1 Uncharacterised protein [Stenotrophomonas maltophilia]